MHDFGTGPRHTDVWNRLADRQHRCRQMVADEPQTCGAATDQGDLTGSSHRPQSRTGAVDAHIAAVMRGCPVQGEGCWRPQYGMICANAWRRRSSVPFQVAEVCDLVDEDVGAVGEGDRVVAGGGVVGDYDRAVRGVETLRFRGAWPCVTSIEVTRTAPSSRTSGLDTAFGPCRSGDVGCTDESAHVGKEDHRDAPGGEG